MDKLPPLDPPTPTSGEGSPTSPERMAALSAFCNSAKEVFASIFKRSNDRWVCKITANNTNQDNSRVEDLMELHFGSEKAANDFAGDWLEQNGKLRSDCVYDALIYKEEKAALLDKEQAPLPQLPDASSIRICEVASDAGEEQDSTSFEGKREDRLRNMQMGQDETISSREESNEKNVGEGGEWVKDFGFETN